MDGESGESTVGEDVVGAGKGKAEIGTGMRLTEKLDDKVHFLQQLTLFDKISYMLYSSMLCSSGSATRG